MLGCHILSFKKDTMQSGSLKLDNMNIVFGALNIPWPIESLDNDTLVFCSNSSQNLVCGLLLSCILYW